MRLSSDGRLPRSAILSLLTVLAGLAVLVLPASGLASASGATTNRVTATVSTSGRGLHVRIHLKIDLNGRTAYSRDVHSSACPPGCVTTPLAGGKSAVRVVDLESDGSTDVVLGLFTGGAHCCFVDQVYALAPRARTFVRSEHNFLDAGAKLADLNGNGRDEFQSADARIAEAGFTDYADSGAPVQIFAFAGNRFRDVTAQYPSRIKTDAARWLSLFQHHVSNGRGLIAAWAADEYRLGDSSLVNTTLATALKKNELRAPPGFGGPSAARFIVQLKTLLGKLGY